MAAAQPVDDGSLTCAVCLEALEEPASLPCGHSFCLEPCLRALAATRRRCPLCRADSVPRSAEELHVNIALRDAVAALRELRRARAVGERGGAAAVRAALLAALPRGAEDLEFDVNAHGVCRELGSGAYGSVLAARLRGGDVAVKTFRHTPAETIWKEAELMSALAHPNLLAVIGVYEVPGEEGEGSKVAIVMPRMRYSLKAWIEAGRRAAPRDEPGLRTRLQLCLHVARGLAHMHSRSFVHRDISHNNVLVDAAAAGGASPAAVLSDLGCSVFRPGAAAGDEQSVRRSAAGTPQFMDPVVATRTHSFRTASDVYSFAILAWEVMSGAQLYPGLDFNGIWPDSPGMSAVIGGARPDLALLRGPELLLGELKPLLARCWAPSQAERPRMRVVVEALERMLNGHALAPALFRAPRVYLRNVRFGSFLSATPHVPGPAWQGRLQGEGPHEAPCALWMSSSGPEVSGWWERFSCVDLDEGGPNSRVLALRTDFGGFVTPTPDRRFNCMPWVGARERLRFVSSFAGGYEVHTAHGTLLAVTSADVGMAHAPALVNTSCAGCEWEVVPAPDNNHFVITSNCAPSFALDTGGDVAPGSPAHLCPPDGHCFQRWRVGPKGRLVGWGDLCLTAPAAGSGGSACTLERLSDELAARQCWRVRWEAAAAAFRLTSAIDGRALDSSQPNFGMAAGAGGGVPRLATAALRAWSLSAPAETRGATDWCTSHLDWDEPDSCVVLFHLRPRPDLHGGVVVMNHHDGPEGWGEEEHFPLSAATPFNVIVRIDEVGFHVSSAATGATLHTFRHRIPWARFALLSAPGDWAVAELLGAQDWTIAPL